MPVLLGVMTGNVLLSQSLALSYAHRRSSLLCCDAECVVEDELVVFILLAIEVKAIFDDWW